MSEPKSSTCTRLAEVMGISYDSVNRFLLRESYDPKAISSAAMGFDKAWKPKAERVSQYYTTDWKQLVCVKR